jgi:hypothetical protein
VAFIFEDGEEMTDKAGATLSCNGPSRVTSRDTWGPAWLRPAAESRGPAPTIEPCLPSWEALSERRRGPGLTDGEPSIDIPRDWRDEVANLPAEEWSRWRALSGELQDGLEGEPTAEDIRAMDHMAFDLVLAEGAHQL